MYCHNAHVKIMDFDGIMSDTLVNVIKAVLDEEYSLFDSAIAEVTFVVEP